MKIPLKIALPLVMGFVSVPLMIWDIHNQGVIRSVGMGWDTGAPLWPYQTPDTVLFALNLPAFLVSNMIGYASSYYFDIGLISPLHYLTFFPAILAWWWLAGWYLDRRSLRRNLPKTMWTAIFLCLLAAGLIALGVDGLRWPIRWWWTYSRSILTATDIILLRLLTPSLWCFALGVVAALAAWRRMHGVTRPVDGG